MDLRGDALDCTPLPSSLDIMPLVVVIALKVLVRLQAVLASTGAAMRAVDTTTRVVISVANL